MPPAAPCSYLERLPRANLPAEPPHVSRADGSFGGGGRPRRGRAPGGAPLGAAPARALERHECPLAADDAGPARPTWAGGRLPRSNSLSVGGYGTGQRDPRPPALRSGDAPHARPQPRPLV